MKPILVHIHIFYPEMWKELRECIKNIAPHPFDMFVTMVEEHSEIQTDIKNNFPSAKIEIVENRGYDVAPFIHVLNQINLDDYSYVVKLHTKRDINKGPYFRNMQGSIWRDTLLSFISSKDMFNKYLEALKKDSQIGMQANHKVIVHHDFYDEYANSEMKKWLKDNKFPHLKYAFVAGTMFIARASIFKDIKKLHLKINDFPATKGEHKTQLAHIFERYLGYITYQNNMTVSDGILPRTQEEKYHRNIYIQMRLIRPFIRLFYQKKITKSGKLCIKICKIPLPVNLFLRK